MHFKEIPTKHALIVDVLDAEPQACWEGADQDVEVEEEGHPRRRLVLRHRCYDGDVDLSVTVRRWEEERKIGGEEERNWKEGRDVIHVELNALGVLRQIIQ